jgi:hypothetical protein
MRIGNSNVAVNTATPKATEQKPHQREPAKTATAATPAVSNASQEARETLAQTKKEAASGDKQAARKLAQETASEAGQTKTHPAVTRSLKITA